MWACAGDFTEKTKSLYWNFTKKIKSLVCGACAGDFTEKKTKSLVCGKFYAAIFAAMFQDSRVAA